MVTDSLQELVQQCLDGEQKSMMALVERYQGQVFGLCLRMLGHRQDAEDVSQETMVRMLRSLHRCDSNLEFEPWLLAIAGNRCRTALANRAKKPAPTQILEPVIAPEHPETGQLSEEVTLALQSVRPEYREVFILFHDQQLCYSEIAEIVGRPVGTVKTWIYRARREILEQLARRGVLEGTTHAVRRV